MFGLRAFSLLSVTAAVVGSAPRRLGGTPSVTSTDPSIKRPVSFTMASRAYVPYGNGNGYAFGMGAAEQMAYDHSQKYAYTISEQGYINVVDYSDPANPQVKSSLAVNLNGAKLTDIEICPQHNMMLVASGASDKVSNGKVDIYTTVQRASPAAPTFVVSQPVGPLPDMILPDSNCTKVAVANEGEGKVIDGSLIDPEGSVDILSMDWTKSPPALARTTVSLGTKTDDELIALGVHMPLTKKAMEYWEDHSGVDLEANLTDARAGYTPNTNLEPEYLSWSADDKRLYVNLQENNAVAVIDVATATLAGIYPLGMKDHGTIPIDIVKDSACNQTTYTNFKALRMPDAIQVVTVDGTNYVLTANEGDDKEYGKFEEKQKLKDIVSSTGMPSLPGMTATADAKAAATLIVAAAKKMRVTIGSSAVNYNNPSAPVLEHIVAMGGRGISIFKDTGSALQLAWDSKGSFEADLCAHYNWSHNGIQDEEFAPLHGVLYNSSGADLQDTLKDMNDPAEDGCTDGGNGQQGACPLGQTVDERSPKDGAGTEAIVAGVACGSLIAVTATEKSGVAFVYDITNITSPALLFVKHLSEASKTKNPGVAYADRTLGEVDPEAMIFLDAAHSPSGKAGVMFAGAWSGTVSFWEFGCPTDPATTTAVPETTLESTSGAAVALPLLSVPLLAALASL